MPPRGEGPLPDGAGPGAGFRALVYKSHAIGERVRAADRAAMADSSVLILGESGVGKELFAERIHMRSPRRLAPFVRVNCAAIPEGLLESELFGHVRGAFTGASGSRKGRFEAADGGTLFLDEIGDLSPALQAKLLRVLQEKAFEKVGSDRTVSVDARILAATNRDIEAMVAGGEFRRDLYYRLNVIPLFIPPLRSRAEDIPELAGFFLERRSRAMGRRFKGFSGGAERAMLGHSWPGNARELENCVERACALAAGEWIEPEDLFPSSQGYGLGQGALGRGLALPDAGGLGSGGASGPGAGGAPAGGRCLKSAVSAFKAGFVREALAQSGWNRTEAAKALGIQRTYLSRLIRELGIGRQ